MHKLARLSLAIFGIFLMLALAAACLPWDRSDSTPAPVAEPTRVAPDVTRTPTPPDDIPPPPEGYLERADVRKGVELFEEKGCVACHKIEEDGPGGEIGPVLAGIGDATNRPMLAADIANTPENIWRWIQFPQLIKPGTEMAPLGMDGEEAAQLVKYLLTLK